MKNEWRLLVVVCVLVIGTYAYMAQSGILELLSPNPGDSYYNLLVEGFQSGHVSLKKEVPLGLTQLPDPYDPTANAVYQSLPYRMLDMSYYKGRLYLYFGVTPALILFWPFTALTGEYLFHRQAVAIFCAVGFLASVGLLRGLWRRYFSEVSVWVVLACALALGLATGVPQLLSKSDVYEVSISCGYMLTMLALGGIWCALHEPEPRKRPGWLAAASVAYGLAVGARPSLLFGAVILLIPVVHSWRERQRVWTLLIAATGPIILIGLGLMLYNVLRFDNPLEFGLHYQLTDKRQIARQFFGLRHLWFNFRVYFLEPVRWSARPPFVRGIIAPPLPSGHANVDRPFGVLTNVPLVWLALGVPLAWRGRSEQAGSVLYWFVTAVALLFGTGALTLGLYYCSASRFELEFLPALLVLAVVGIFGLECALADRPVWRRTVRCGWGVLLSFSVAFNLLASIEDYARVHNHLGLRSEEMGQMQEALGHFKQAVRLKPDFAPGQNNLGDALLRMGRPQEAIGHFEQALQINPDLAEAHGNLGFALSKLGKLSRAIEEFQRALRLKPDFALWHNNLGSTFSQAGKVPEAISEYEQAVRINPDFAEAYFSLGLALEKLGRTPEAIEHYQQALKLRPDFAPARKALARLQGGE